MSLLIVDTPFGAPGLPTEPRPDSWNPELDPALIAAPGIEAALQRLHQPGALVVTTGQQPGLFTGPGYSVTKALSARALALALERRWQRPVVPVYWIPGDDHDLQEVATVFWLGGDGSLLSASLAPRPTEAPLTPMWRQRLGGEVTAALDRFEQSFEATADRAATVDWLRRHYRPDATVAGAYGSALAELLAPLGIVCLDSSHPAVKKAEAPLLLRALRLSLELEQDLARAATNMQAAGVDPGVAVGDGATPVFLDGDLGRDRLLRTGTAGTFQLRRGQTRISFDALERIAATEPTRLSGNVLLRPVLESALLPTVAYAAGPAELRYLALTPPLYERLGVPRQLAVPRWSGLLVEPRVSRVLRKYGTTIEELLTDGGLEARIAKQALPEGTDARFQALRQAIHDGYEPLIRAVAGVDPTLERPAEAARAHALHGLEELEKKLLQHARKRESVELGQVARARASVRPNGKPQERVASMAGFLARYGSGVVESLADHITRWYG
ncbi:MAG TPA: bacillithiol biosynthesis cysteine-adding enzyme BshC [Gemmatimonadales bacterium]|nr:bacillithiol biosynthesis cysteine-adding enzyme BshC [Gemmatimonadales bacterium]